MSQSTQFVGLDVHAKQTHAGIFDRETESSGAAA